MLDETGSKQKPDERPEIVDGVFMIKLKELLRDMQGKRFRETTSSEKKLLIYYYVLCYLYNSMFKN